MTRLGRSTLLLNSKAPEQMSAECWRWRPRRNRLASSASCFGSSACLQCSSSVLTALTAHDAMHMDSTDLILLECSADEKAWLLHYSLTAAVSNVVVCLVRCFVLVVFKPSSFPIIKQPQQPLTAVDTMHIFHHILAAAVLLGSLPILFSHYCAVPLHKRC